MNKKISKKRYREMSFVLVVLSFMFFFYFLIFWGPFFFELYLSLSIWNLMGKPIFIGISNFTKMWTDRLFWNGLNLAIRYTLVYVCVGIPIQLGLALGLNSLRKKWLRHTLLGLYFIPVVSSTVGIAIVWRLLYAPNYGQINAILNILGLPTQGFLMNSKQALICIAGVGVWKITGLGTVIFLAGLGEIPDVFYEAARIDGASRWVSFYHITMPLLKRVFTFQLTMVILWGMQMFDLIYVMNPSTVGGPGISTNVLGVYIYRTGIKNLDLGYAATMALVLFLILLTATALQLKFLTTKWEY